MALEEYEQKEFVSWFRAEYPKHTMALRVSQSGGYRGKAEPGQYAQPRLKAKERSQGRRT